MNKTKPKRANKDQDKEVVVVKKFQKKQNKQKPSKWKTLGGAIGNLVGAKQFGNKVGSFFGPILKKITGVGDYKINTNPIIKNSLMSGNQPLAFNGKQSSIIRHREYITDLITSGTAGQFDYKYYYVNPGNNDIFPWLSQLASNYESYRIHGLVFEFRSMSGNALNSTNTALGSVIMSAQYDAQNAPFTNKQMQEQYENSISFKSSENAFFGLECKKSQNVLSELYVNNGQLPTSVAPQFVNMAQFQVSTVGFQGTNVNIGELWVTYEIELFHPKIGAGYSLEGFNVQLSGNTTNVLFDGVQTQWSGNLDVMLNGNTVTILNARPGSYYHITVYRAGENSTDFYPSNITNFNLIDKFNTSFRGGANSIYNGIGQVTKERVVLIFQAPSVGSGDGFLQINEILAPTQQMIQLNQESIENKFEQLRSKLENFMLQHNDKMNQRQNQQCVSLDNEGRHQYTQNNLSNRKQNTNYSNQQFFYDDETKSNSSRKL